MSITKTTTVRWSDAGFSVTRTTGPTRTATGDTYAVEGLEGRNLYEDGLRRLRVLIDAALSDAASVAVAPKISTMPVRGDLGVSASGFDAKPYEGLRVTGEAKFVTTETRVLKVGDVVRWDGRESYDPIGLVLTKGPVAGAFTSWSLDRNCDGGDVHPDIYPQWVFVRPATPAERAAAGLPTEGGAE